MPTTARVGVRRGRGTCRVHPPIPTFTPVDAGPSQGGFWAGGRSSARLYRVRAKTQARGFTLVEMMIVVAIVGILASIAIPQFVGFNGRARQAEAKTNLRAWYLAQTGYFSESGRYSEQLIDSVFLPERGNRYAYLFGGTCTYQTRAAAVPTTPLNANCVSADVFRYPSHPMSPAPAAISAAFAGAGANPGLPGLGGTCPDCNIAAVATANIDNEGNGIDTWLVSTKPGTVVQCIGGGQLVTGLAVDILDDVSCD